MNNTGIRRLKHPLGVTGKLIMNKELRLPYGSRVVGSIIVNGKVVDKKRYIMKHLYTKDDRKERGFEL